MRGWNLLDLDMGMNMGGIYWMVVVDMDGYQKQGVASFHGKMPLHSAWRFLLGFRYLRIHGDNHDDAGEHVLYH